jgi:hypothetical protein
VRRSITATLLEDAHPGSGTGGAGIDSLVARARDGRPVIWSSHVKGLLREAARSLYGERTSDRLFGSRGRARQRILSTSLYADTSPACRIWRSTARESLANRAPRSDTLRALELVPEGTCFRGQVELPISDLDLVERLFQEVDAVGRGRASGAGRVAFELRDVPAAPRPVGPATSRLLLLLRNLDPLCVAATALPGNLIPTLPFLPGRTLLGAAAGWLLAEGEDDAARLLVDGSLSVGDALPVPGDDDRTVLSFVEVLPAPLGLKSEKAADPPGTVPWWAFESLPPRRLDAHAHPSTRLKRPEPDLFIRRVKHGAWSAYRPEIRVRLRNGRPDPEQPAPSLFATEEIAEKTCFLAEIRGDASLLASLRDALRPVLEGRRWLRVGRGGVAVEVAALGWARPPRPSTAREDAYLTLTSDLLVRDRRLRWLIELRPEDFAELPGWPAGVTATPLFQDHEPVKGFNGTSRLWRLPAAAIRRGSVFAVAGEGVGLLAAAAAAGQWLGERTHEGFGRFRVDEELPGASDEAAKPDPRRLREAASRDEEQDAIARTTHGWLCDHPRLKDPGTADDRRPSLSQWQGLVTDLAAGRADALTARQKPSTAGASGWKAEDARKVLRKLGELADPESQASHARMFLRWLRTERRKEKAR